VHYIDIPYLISFILSDVAAVQCNDARKFQTQPPFYMSFSEHCVGSDQKLNNVNALRVETLLCSTKFTQNGNVFQLPAMFAFLRASWKECGVGSFC